MSKAKDQSRNSWINKDIPKNVSSQAHYKDGYEDILEERRHESDFKYCVRTRQNVPRYKYNVHREPADVKKHVLTSDRVQYVIEQLATTNHVSQDVLRKEAKDILDEMAHNLSTKATRGFAFALMKVFKALFNRIYVNEDGIQMLRKLLHEYPVILMPTHRSYMDFLLVSYAFYHYDLPLPVIAAAMDFKSMKFVGWLLKNSGAFYIRRSFGSDKLYWAIFTEYVQTQLRNGDNPLEFFVEGTRSRTAKSYSPKIGMLSATIESYFKAEVPDLMIVPISISYERILEESLYAYELLGIPKPKESTSGLLKARSILNEDFGSVHFHVCPPISIRDLSVGRVDRVLHGLEPRYINNLTDREQVVTNELAYKIVLDQQRHLVISPWALMATVIMLSRDGISVRQLVKEVEWLKQQAYNLGGYVDWPGNTNVESIIQHYLKLHTNVVCAADPERIVLKLVRPAHVAKLVHDDVMLNAATNIMLASYRNQLLHTFVSVGMIALAVNSCSRDTIVKGELFEKYSFLENLFSKDFVFMPGTTKQIFEHAVLELSHSGGLVIQDDIIYVKKSINKHTTFFSQMFEPFLVGYWVLCHHLISMPGDLHGRPVPKKPKAIARDAQKLGIRLLQENVLKHHEVLSLDLLSNGLNALVDMGAMFKDKRNEEPWLSPNQVVVSDIADRIANFVEVPPVAITTVLAVSKDIVIAAKL